MSPFVQVHLLIGDGTFRTIAFRIANILGVNTEARNCVMRGYESDVFCHFMLSFYLEGERFHRNGENWRLHNIHSDDFNIS